MKPIGHQNIASSILAVTGTATLFYTLMDTAGSVSNSAAYHNSPNNGGPANGLIITPEDGDIRIDYSGLTPTAALGLLLTQGTKYILPNIDLNKLRLIRTGGSNVSCSVHTILTGPGDEFAAVLESATITGTVTVDSEFPAAAAITDDFANPTTTSVMAMGMAWDGATWDRMLGDSTDGLLVNLGSNNDVTLPVGTAVMTGSTPVTIATDDTMFTALDTAVDTIAGAVSGTEMQVDVVASLPAGTNAIGKLAANSGVDIGDVDVTSSPIDGSINGPGAPTIDSYTHAAINLTTGANQVLVSSAANKQVWVYGVTFTCGDADGQTVSFQDEDDTAISGVMEFPQYGGMAHAPSGNFAMPLWKLATDKDLEVDITGGDVDGFITYAIVSV